jgi:predicted MPP superfamily phosphohydrolase
MSKKELAKELKAVKIRLKSLEEFLGVYFIRDENPTADYDSSEHVEGDNWGRAVKQTKINKIVSKLAEKAGIKEE